MDHSSIQKTKKCTNCIKTLLLIISMGICFFIISLFRIVDVKRFFAVLFVVGSIYFIIKKHPRAAAFSFKENIRQTAIACILECLLFVDFSSYILDVSPSILRIVPISPTITGLCVCLVCCVCSFLFLYEVAGLLKGLLYRLTIICKAHRYSFILLSAIFAIGIAAIIRADFNYYDDLGRIHTGLEMTGSFSRHTATFLSNFLHGNTRLFDISPLSQIVAVLILALTGVLLLNIFDEVFEKQPKFDIWRVVALVPLCFSPYYLPCLTYKFDSPYMAASILFSVLPLIYYKASPKKYIFAVAVGIILMCTTYQASSGIFPILVILLSLVMWLRKVDPKKIGSFIFRSVCGYVGGMLIFKFLIMTQQDSYIESTISLRSLTDNLVYYYRTFLECFTPLWIALIMVTCIAFMIAMIKISKRHIASALPVSIITIVCMSVLSFGAYLVFANILHAVRSMYGFCICLTLLGLAVTTVFRTPIAKTSVFLFGWLMFSFVFTYGNALTLQKEYSSFRLEEVVSELKQIEAIKNNEPVYVQIVGSIGKCDPVADLTSEYKVLDRLVPTVFSESQDDFGYNELFSSYRLNLCYDETLDMTQMDLPITSDTAYHTIKSDGHYVLVYLK